MNDEKDNLLLTHTISNNESFIDDIIDITDTITNQGTKEKTNVKIKSIISEYFEFVVDSVSIDGISSTLNINDEIVIDSIPVGATRTITYKLKALKQYTNVITYFNLSCEYLDDEGNTKVITKSSDVLHSIILKQRVGVLMKSTMKDTKVGDINHYHIDIKNYDKVNSITELQFRNAFSGNYLVDADTILVNGTTKVSTISPIAIDEIRPGEIVTIDFDAEAQTPGNIEFDSLIDYKYLLNGTLTRKIDWLLTLNSTVYENDNVNLFASLEVVYNNSPTLYLPNFTIKLENKGTTEIIDANVTMDLSDYCNMIESSLQVNGVRLSGDVTSGIKVSSILPGETATITFTGSPLGIMNEKQVYATVNYSYMKNASKVSGKTYTNSIFASLSGLPDGEFAMSIVPDKNSYSVGEKINFEILAYNNTDYKIDKLEIQPNLPDSIRYLKGTLKIDGQSSNYDNGIVIDELLNYGDFKKITFSAIALRESSAKVDAITTYTFDIGTTQKSISESYASNFEIKENDLVEINTTFISNVPHITKVGDVVTFTLDIKNDNDYGIPINNVLFKPIFATNKSDKEYLSIDLSTLTQDGVKLTNKDTKDYFILNDIDANQTSTIKFSAYAVNISADEIFNYVDILYQYEDDYGNIQEKNSVDDYGLFITSEDLIDVQVTKNINESEVYVGDTIHYNVELTNNSDIDLKYVYVKDYMDQFVNVKRGSLYVDGTPYSHLSIEDGFDLTALDSKETRTMEFELEAKSIGTYDNILTVAAKSSDSDIVYGLTSNIATTKINEVINASYSVVVNCENQVGKIQKTKGDVVTFDVTVTNVGNVEIQDLQIIEELDSHFEYIEDSLMLDHHKLNRSLDNILIDTLSIKESRTLTFEATCINGGENIENQIKTSATYLDNEGLNQEIIRNSNALTFDILDDSKKVTFNLSSNKKIVAAKEEVEFTALIKNEKDEDITIENLVFNSILDDEYFELDIESIKQDGTKIPFKDSKYLLNSLASGAVSYITFVAVAKKQVSKTIINSIIDYDYIKDGVTYSAQKISKCELGIIDTINYNFLMNLSSNKVREVKNKTIHFTLELANTTSNLAKDIYIYQDFNIDSFTIVPATTKLNGSIIEDINNGVNIKEFKPNERITIEFDAIGIKEGTYPITLYMEGNTLDKYFGMYSNTREVTILPNKLSDIEIIESTDKSNYTLNELVNFNVLINNIGSEDPYSLTLIQNIGDSLEYVQNSLIIDGISSNDQIDNIQIGDFDEDKIELSFKCKCIKSSLDVEQSMSATFNYLNEEVEETKTVTSNTTIINILEDDSIFLNTYLSVDTPIVDIHNMTTLTATLSIENKSDYDIDLNSLKLAATLRNGNYKILEDSFMQDGTIINPTTFSLYTLTNGYDLTPISANTTSNITFSLSPIDNQYATDNLTVDLEYTYTNKDGIEKEESISETTNIYYVDKVGNDSLELEFSANPSKCLVNDIVHYTLIVKNISGTTLTSFDIQNIFPNELIYIPGTTLIDGVISTDEINSIAGLVINKTLYLNSTIKIEFDAKASKTGEYTDEIIVKGTHSGGDLSVAYGQISNTTITVSDSPIIDIEFLKQIDFEDLRINEQYQITLNITNKSNVTLKNIIVNDILDEALEFVLDTLKINNQIISGRPNYIEIEKLDVDEVATITFDILTTKVKNNVTNKSRMTYEYENNNGMIESNLLEFDIKDPINISVDVIKSSDKNTYIEQEEAIFTITIQNNSNIDLKDVTIFENLDESFGFIEDTITIDDEEYIGNLDNILIDTIKESEIKTIKFHARALVAKVGIENIVDVNVNYNSKDDLKSEVIQSNTINLDIVEALSPSLKISKTSNKTDYLLNEIATFTTTIENIGDTTLIDGKLISELNSSLEFVPNSIKINGNTFTGTIDNIPFGQIDIGNTTIVSYQAKCIGYRNDLIIQDSISMNYIEQGITKYFNALSNEVSININNVDFKITQTLNNGTFRIDKEETITTLIENTGEKPIENLALIVDFDSEHLEFVPNSIKVDNITLSQDIEHAILIPVLEVGKSITVTFDVIPIKIGKATNGIEGVGSYQGKGGALIPITKYSNNLEVDVLESLSPDFTAVLTVAKETITIEEVVSYNLTITNTGDTDFEEVLLTDILDSSIELIAESVMVNGIQKITDVLDNLNLGSLKVGETIVVSFQAKPLIILNDIANISYVTTFYESSGRKQLDKTSNFAFVSVVPLDVAFITFSQEVNSSTVNVGDNIDFTLTFKNTGTKEINALKIYNNLNACLQYIDDSIYVDDVLIPNINITNGYELQSLALGEEHKLRFSVKTINTAKNIDNISMIQCVSNGNLLEFSSNPVNLSIEQNFAVLVTKTSSKTEYNVGDIVSFVIKVKNTGDVDFTSVHITDNLVSNIEFTQGSMQVNGTKLMGDIKDGVNLYNIKSGEERTIYFEATALTPGIDLENFATADISYFDGSITQKAQIESSIVKFSIAEAERAQLVLTKSIAKKVLKVGELTTFTIVAKNTGNVVLNQVIVYDRYSLLVDIAPGTLKVDGKPVTGDIQAGILLGPINPNTSKTITFEVKALSPSSSIVNIANATYDYTIGGAKFESEQTSIPIIFEIVSEDEIELVTNKSSNKNTYKVGESATFTLQITNIGTTHIKNVIVLDKIPNNYTFTPNTVKVDGVLTTADIRDGVNIGALQVNNNSIITFEAVATTLGVDISNEFDISYTIGDTSTTGTSVSAPYLTTITDHDAPALVFTKTSDKTIYNQGDIIHYTLSINNPTNIPVSSLSVMDILDKNTTFITNSVKVDGEVSQDSILTGVDVGSIPSGFTRKVTFDAEATNQAKDIPNSATATYNYIYLDKEYSETIHSNTIKINILEYDCPKASLIKQAINKITILGEKNTFLITIKNEGKTNIENAKLIDLLDDSYQFIPDSLEVGGKITSGDITQGITINILAEGQETVKFSALAKEIKQNIDNKATLLYPCKDRMLFEESNVVVTNIIEDKKATVRVFKEFRKITISLEEKDTVTLTVINAGNVEAQNIIVKDLLPSAYELVPGTLTIDDVISDEDIFEGVEILNLMPNKEKKISFQVKGVKLEDNIHNTAEFSYSYIDLMGSKIMVNSVSNETTTFVTDMKKGLLMVEKAQSDLSLLVGDTTTVTLTVTNVGNVEIENINLIDLFASNYEQVGTTVVVDGKEEEANMSTGVLLNPMKPNQKRVITFPMVAVHVGKNVQNIGRVTYTYQEATTLQTIYSNPVLSDITETPIADLEITKMALPTTVLVGDTIKYSFKIENVGKVRATNVYFSDIFDTRLKLDIDSILILGETTYLEDLSKVPLGNIDPKDYVTIEANVKALSPGDNIENTSSVTYKYQTGTQEHTVTKTSNKVSINIKENIIPEVTLTQTVSKKELKINDVNMFNFTVKNNSNFILNDFMLEKILPDNYSLIKESLELVRTIGEEEIITPLTEAVIPLINPFEELNIRFSAYASLAGNNISNIVKAKYLYTDLVGRKQIETISSNDFQTTIIDKESPNILFTKNIDGVMQTSKESTVTLFIQNQGNIPISKVRIVEQLPDEISYVENSLTVDNIPVLYSIVDGLYISELLPTRKATITFKVVPKVQNKIVNSKTILTYQYTDKSGLELESKVEIDSEIQIVPTLEPIVDVNLYTDLNNYFVNDFINYRIMISLMGVTDMKDVIVKLPLLDNYEFIDNSLIVNGKDFIGDIKNGINIGNIISPKDVVILFRARALKEGTNLNNMASVTYTYQIDMDPPITKTINSNTITHNITIREFSVITNKTSLKKGLMIGEINQFTINLINDSTHPIQNIRISDVLDPSYRLVEGTLKINGIATVQTLNEILIDNLMSKNNLIIMFDAKAMIPKKNILNSANISCEFIDDKGDIVEVDTTTNTVETTIIKTVNQAIINLIEQIANEEENISNLLTVETKKLERTLEVGTIEEILDMNSLILEMVVLLLIKEQNSLNNLTTIINNL